MKMGKVKNYSKMFEAENQESITDPTSIPEEVAVTEEPVTPKKKVKKIKGVVIGCAKLNVREHPSTESTVLCTVPASSEVRVVANEKHDEWYHVFTETGVEGYCMKKYISVEK
jgi:uncharacterized protein YgiM (DUF1202 family)